MTKKISLFLKKCIFVIKEVYKADSRIMLILVLFMIISGISPLLTTFATTELIKLFEQNIDTSTHNKILLWGSIIIFSVAANIFITNVKYSVSEFAGYKLSHNIENIVAEKFQEIPQEIIDCPDFLDLYKNAAEQSSYAPLGILENLFNIISSTIGLIGYLLILLRLNVGLVFLLITFTVPIYYMKYVIQNQSFNFLKNTTNRYREIQYYFALISDKKYSNEIRTFDLFDCLSTKRKKLFSGLINERKNILNKSILYILGITFIAIVLIGLLEISLIKNLLNHSLALSDFILYNSATISLEIGLFSFVDQIVDNNKSMQFLDYLFEFLNYKVKKKIVETSVKKISEPYEFIFDNVSFKYPGTNRFCLEGINLKIKSGEKICLVGENGSGKTTLVKLLLRIYEPSSGQIFLNGTDIKSYNLKDYQALFSTVFQDFIHYFLDVKSNVIYGNVKKIDDIAYLKKVLDKTNSTPFIENYPSGYDTKLSKEFYNDGIEPSIGQWQKLAISRAAYRNSPIFILDEPTASLDPKSEEEIFKLFNNLGQEKTVLIISHRMFCAKLSNKIVLLDKGKILESGTHFELIRKKGKYNEFYSLQANKYIVDH